MKIVPNTVYRSKTGEAVVMPIASTSERVVLHIGQRFGTRILFLDNRRTTMSRTEFESNFERDDE